MYDFIKNIIGSEQINKELDMFVILRRVEEIDKLKKIILS